MELPYPPTALGLEVVFLLFYAVIEPVRLFLGAWRRSRTSSGARFRALRRPATLPPPKLAARLSAPTGSRGNKTESVRPLAWSLGLALPVVVFNVYVLSLQTYV